jgi:hypothetical protein
MGATCDKQNIGKRLPAQGDGLQGSCLNLKVHSSQLAAAHLASAASRAKRRRSLGDNLYGLAFATMTPLIWR